MAKFKRRRVQKVYPNRYRNTWSPDEQQASLVPGTEMYNQRQADKLLDGFDGTKDDEEVVEALDLQIDDQDEKKDNDAVEAEFSHEVYNVGKRKYRRYMSKEVQVKKTKKIIEDALVAFPGEQSIDEELYDDGVSADTFVEDVVSDYAKEADAVLASLKDNNGDGKVDEDDCPGLRRLRKYM